MCLSFSLPRDNVSLMHGVSFTTCRATEGRKDLFWLTVTEGLPLMMMRMAQSGVSGAYSTDPHTRVGPESREGMEVALSVTKTHNLML